MEHIDKLNLNFTAAQVLKAQVMNIITGKIDEVVDAANHVNVVESKAEENRILINNMKEEAVDISQADFDALQESGELDETKTYYIYE